MANVLVVPAPYGGHVIPSLGLSRRLGRLGHQVSYLSTPTYSGQLREQGFRCVEFLERIPTFYYRRRIADVISEYNRIDFAALFREVEPDLIIADRHAPTVVVPARALGIPSLLFCTSLPPVRDRLVPPLTIDRAPGRSIASRARTSLDWERAILSRRVRDWLTGFAPRFRALVQRHHYPSALLDHDSYVAFGPGFRLPTAVLCAEAFDFPRSVPDHHFIGPCIDEDRREVDFPWSRLDERRKLVLCSLGSGAYLAHRHPGFLRAVIGAMGSMPGHEAVVVGGEGSEQWLGPVPDNVILVPSMPQRALLERASLMITSGGLGTIKESILAGVPMLVFPFVTDQPGNAARVRYHGLGLVGSPRQASAPEFRRLIEALSAGPFRQNVARMRQAFQDAEARGLETLGALVQGALAERR